MFVVVRIEFTNRYILAFNHRSVSENEDGLENVEHGIIAVEPRVAIATVAPNACAIDGDDAATGPTFHIEVDMLHVAPRGSGYHWYSMVLIEGCHKLVAKRVPELLKE